MKLPRLSVILPNYNHAQHLPMSLGALLAQSAAAAEIIVIDDASTDNSLDVLAQFARAHPQLRVHRNERNRGVVYNMNLGIELATGDYVFFAAADDEVQPGLFEKSLGLLSQHPQAALSCSASRWHDAKSGLSWYMGTGMSDRPAYLSPDDLVEVGRKGKLLIVSASAIMRKEPLVKAGKFLADLRWHCDWYATYVTAFRHGICYVPEPLSDFYLHSTSYYNRGRRSEEHAPVLAKLLDLLTSPELADIAPRVRDSAALALFEMPVLKLMVRHKPYRQFLTGLLVRRCFRRNLEVVGKKLLPRPLASLALKLRYRQRTAQPKD